MASNPKKKKYEAKFADKWLTDPKFKLWLKKASSTSAHCSLCKKDLHPSKQSLSDHAKTAGHVRQTELAGIAAKQASIMENFLGVDQLKETKEKELQQVAFIAEHLSFNSAKHLSTLVKRQGGPAISMGRTKATKIVTEVMAPSYSEQLLDEVRHKPFSLIIDESTDIGSEKVLALMIRYFNGKKICDSFYDFVSVTHTDATTITNVIVDKLKMDNLPLVNLVGLGVDGASSMVGRLNSVAIKMKELIPHLTTVRCVPHSLAKVASWASKKLPCHLQYMVSQVHTHFSRSAIKRSKFLEIHEAL